MQAKTKKFLKYFVISFLIVVLLLFLAVCLYLYYGNCGLICDGHLLHPQVYSVERIDSMTKYFFDSPKYAWHVRIESAGKQLECYFYKDPGIVGGKTTETQPNNFETVPISDSPLTGIKQVKVVAERTQSKFLDSGSYTIQDCEKVE